MIYDLFISEMEDQYSDVELYRSSHGFGFTISGGQEYFTPLFIKKITIDGPAAIDGRLSVGDEIVEINGVDSIDMTHSQAIELIKYEERSIKLRVKRVEEPPLSIMGKLVNLWYKSASIRGQAIEGSVEALIIGKSLNPSKLPYLEPYGLVEIKKNLL